MIKVIWHKTSLPSYLDGSIVIGRWRQCAPHLINPNWHLHHTGAASCSVAVSISTAGHVQACSGPARPDNCPFTRGDLDIHLIHDSFGLSKLISQTTTRSVQPFLQCSRCDRPRYIMCKNRPHLQSTAMWPNNNNNKWLK